MEVDSDGNDFAKGGTGEKGDRAGEKGKARRVHLYQVLILSPCSCHDKLQYLFNLSTNGDYLSRH